MTEPHAQAAGGNPPVSPQATLNETLAEPDLQTRSPSVLDPGATPIPAHQSHNEGTGDLPIMSSVKYFQLEHQAEFSLYQYSVDFIPPQRPDDVEKAHREVFEHFLVHENFVFVRQPLPFKLLTLADEAMKMIVRYVKELLPTDPTFVQVYNLLLQRCLGKLDFAVLSQDFDERTPDSMLEMDLQVWPSYRVLVCPDNEGILVIADVIREGVCTSNILEVIKLIMKRYPGAYQGKCRKLLVGQTVRADYKKRSYRVDGITWNENLETTFDQNSKKNVFDHYKSVHNIDIQDKEQPLLIHTFAGNQHRAPKFEYLIPELCHMTRQNLRTETLVDEAHLGTGTDTMSKFLEAIITNETVERTIQNWGLRFESKSIVTADMVPSFGSLVVGNDK